MIGVSHWDCSCWDRWDGSNAYDSRARTHTHESHTDNVSHLSQTFTCMGATWAGPSRRGRAGGSTDPRLSVAEVEIKS